MMSSTVVCSQNATSDSQSVTHVLPNLPPLQRTKILRQLDTYLKIADDSLTKFVLTTNKQGPELHLNLTIKKEKARDSLRGLVHTKKFSQSQPQIVKMFAKLCKTVEKMHKTGIAHNAIFADRLYFEGGTFKLSLPSFTLISKAKRKYCSIEEIPSCLRGLSYECMDIFSLGIILLEMLTKTEQNISAITTSKLDKIISAVSSHLRTLLYQMFSIRSHKILTISDVLAAINTRLINPQVIQHPKRQSENLQEVTLFTLFSSRKMKLKMPANSNSNNKAQTIIKETQQFVIYIHWLKNSQALCFEFVSISRTSIVMSYLYTKNLFASSPIKEFFESTTSLFAKLKENETSLFIKSSGEVIIGFKAAPKQPKPIIFPDISSKRAAIIKYEQWLRQKEEQMKLLLIVAQDEPFRNNKQSLNFVEELIHKSRCLPQDSKVVLAINSMWKKVLILIIRDDNLEDLLNAMRICEKYWLQSDQIMNIMRKRVTQILQSGIMNYLY